MTATSFVDESVSTLEPSSETRDALPTPLVVAVWAGSLGYTSWLLRHPPSVLLVAVAIMLNAVAAGVILISQRRARISSALSILGLVLFLTYVVRPLALSENHAISYATILNRKELTTPLLLSSGFCASIALGVFIARLPSVRASTGVISMSRTSRKAFTQIRTRRAFLVAGGCAALSVYLLQLNVRTTGQTLASAYADPTTFRSLVNVGGQFYISGLCIAAAWVPYWLVLVLVKTRARADRYLYLFSTFAFGLAMTYPYGQRSYVLAPLVGLVAWHEMRRGHLRMRTMLAVVVVVAMFVGAYATFRSINSGATGTPSYTVNQSVSDFSGRFDSFDFFAQTQQTFRGRLWGRSLVDFLEQPIPRSVFPNKPSQTSAYLITKQQPDSDRQFTPEYGVVTELYINVGLLGILFGGLLFGYATCRFSELADRSVNDPRQALLLLPFVSFPAQWLMGGMNSFTSIQFLLFGFLYLLVARVVVRRSWSSGSAM